MMLLISQSHEHDADDAQRDGLSNLSVRAKKTGKALKRVHEDIKRDTAFGVLALIDITRFTGMTASLASGFPLLYPTNEPLRRKALKSLHFHWFKP
jgi:hypothetical protein